ncbi:MAG: hypothetical protein JXB18_00935, partial [Sedimentisphaerales bacterium]|nr:hypothetical protein [Sedimentisphaerales bacterium]
MRKIVFLLFVLLCTPVFASEVSISLNPANWIKYRSDSATAVLTQNADGSLRATCNTYRGWMWYRTQDTYNLQGATIRYKWRMHCANNYAWTQDGLYPWAKMSPQNLTTHHSWASSIVISTNTWIYTEVHFNQDRTWTSDYSYNNYQGQPGSTRITGNSGVISDANWDLLANSCLNKYMGDGYASSFYFEIGEAYYTAPEPKIEITQPAQDTIFKNGDLVTLAVELISGAQPPYSFTWTSDIDGTLGTGENLQINTLSLGQHLIICQMDYGDNQSVQSTVRVKILAVPEIEPLGDQAIADGQAYVGPTPVLNSGAGDVEWSLIDGPSGMTINPATGAVTWAEPMVNPAGYTIVIEASNPVGTALAAYTLTVLEAPVIEQADDQIILYGSSYLFDPVLVAGTLPLHWELIAGP